MEYSVWMFLFTLIFVGVLSETAPCSQQSDCQANECCINRIRPIGKRAINGYCQPLGIVNSGCFVQYGSAANPPANAVFGCPCSIPLICKGRGIFAIPLGELGYCEPSKQKE